MIRPIKCATPVTLHSRQCLGLSTRQSGTSMSVIRFLGKRFPCLKAKPGGVKRGERERAMKCNVLPHTIHTMGGCLIHKRARVPGDPSKESCHLPMSSLKSKVAIELEREREGGK